MIHPQNIVDTINHFHVVDIVNQLSLRMQRSYRPIPPPLYSPPPLAYHRIAQRFAVRLECAVLRRYQSEREIAP
jgi:hypothetical protein